MQELWTLPKAERHSIENRRKQLSERISERRSEIIRYTGYIETAQYELTKLEKELKKISS